MLYLLYKPSGVGKKKIPEAFLRGYLEGLAYVKSQKDVTMKIIGKYTRQRDPEVLEKFYDDLVPDLPRIPYVDDASAAQRSRRPLIVPVSE